MLTARTARASRTIALQSPCHRPDEESSVHVRRLFAAAAASALALLGVGLSAAPATAAELVVTNTDNAGAGSLRDTILSSSPGDTIVFDPVVFSTPQTIN